MGKAGGKGVTRESGSGKGKGHEQQRKAKGEREDRADGGKAGKRGAHSTITLK